MKKKKRCAPPPSKPGIARQHLLDFYDTIQEHQPAKIGHILHIFIENEKSVAKTIRALESVLKPPCLINPNDLKPIVSQFDSYKHLSRDTERRAFYSFCNGVFTSFTVPVALSSSGQESNDKTSECLEQYSVPCPMEVDTSCSAARSTPLCIRPSRVELTPRKLKMKQRLQYLSIVRSSEKQKLKKRLKSLNEKLDTQKFNQIKYLKQDIKRKQESIKRKCATITALKTEIRSLKKGTNGSEEVDVSVLKRKHEARIRRLKESYRRKKRKSETISIVKYSKLKVELQGRDEMIKQYENQLCEFQEQIAELQSNKNLEKETKKDGKTYNTATRMIIYDSIINNVPTQNIPILMESHAKRSGEMLTSTPHRTTIEQMARELDSIADLKTAEVAMKTKHLTLGFDATTQEGVHINSIHLTSETECNVVAVDELAGGTADDYHKHITTAVDYLAEVYSDFHAEDYQYCRSNIIDNISNTMNDRVNVNHATIKKVNETWGKTLNELNCHLHPLDTIASTCRSTLKSLETSKGDLYGKDCVVGNIVLQVNKLRYKDGKGDPKGFKVFLNDNSLPKGILPRYRGNRLHILFHICGTLFEHHQLFLKFFTNGAVSCGGLVSSIRKDFSSTIAILEMQVLGLIGKLLTGPWMQLFYTPAQSEIDHVKGISVVKEAVSALRCAANHPNDVLHQAKDFFGRDLSQDDKTLLVLRETPKDQQLFEEMMSACLFAIIAVIERQYKRYFELELTDKLQEETRSARTHNIDAEEIMGMYSAGKERAKNANIDFLASRMRAKKNQVVLWLDGHYREQRDSIIKWAIGRSRKKGKRVRKRWGNSEGNIEESCK